MQKKVAKLSVHDKYANKKKPGIQNHNNHTLSSSAEFFQLKRTLKGFSHLVLTLGTVALN